MVIKSRMRDVNHTNFKVEDVVVGDEVCIFNVRLTQKMTTEVKNMFIQRCIFTYCPICRLDTAVRHITVSR